ncbi:MAG: hypothetical protein MUO50_04155 [Longimicrobiales bacterium]|nr:hypothetical protein [Longimicrobiales bacterium]
MAHQLRVLGSPEVLDGDGNLVPLSLGKPLALLIYVACSSTPVSRGDVADRPWGEIRVNLPDALPHTEVLVRNLNIWREVRY